MANDLRRIGRTPAILIVVGAALLTFLGLTALGSGSNDASPERAAAAPAAQPRAATHAARRRPRRPPPPPNGKSKSCGIRRRLGLRRRRVPRHRQRACGQAEGRRGADYERPGRRGASPGLRAEQARRRADHDRHARHHAVRVAARPRPRRADRRRHPLRAEHQPRSCPQAVAALQSAARAGGNPPLVIATDQEGGPIRRIAGAPPVAAAAQIAPASAQGQGLATAQALSARGINTDLAPVADVLGPGGFLGSRSFGASPGRVAAAACGFARGLQAGGVNATFKHFPGLGKATKNTDVSAVTRQPHRRGAGQRPGRLQDLPAEARDALKRRLPGP